MYNNYDNTKTKNDGDNMKNKKFFILILLMVIGFASVSATLVINGNTKVAANLDDFNVIFIEGFLNGEPNESVVISGDKKTLTFKTNILTDVNDNARVDYKVKNISTQYDGNVIINCTNEANEHISVTSSFDGKTLPLTNSINMQAQEVKSGIINAELTKATIEDQDVKITCKIEVNAISRTNYAYTLSFNSNGGTNVENKIVEYNTSYGTLSTPTKEGYKFIGWFTDNDVKVDENTILDIKGNKTLTAKWKEKCQYEIGQSWNINYANEVQEFPVPCDGKYKLEVAGAAGETVGRYSGGYGGYSSGELNFEQSQMLYIVTGGNLFNGGGSQYGGYGGNGGGATHIAKTNRGELKNYVDNKDEILIVAGGGGAGYNGSVQQGRGGSGGGEVGGRGSHTATGGSQTSGGSQSGSFGQGGTIRSYCSGGGGGWYGGGAGGSSGGGGGSGYIGGIENGIMTAGQNSGNGYAVITYLGE